MPLLSYIITGDLITHVAAFLGAGTYCVPLVYYFPLNVRNEALTQSLTCLTIVRVPWYVQLKSLQTENKEVTT